MCLNCTCFIYLYIWLYLRKRGKVKEEKTQIENGWTHTADTEIQTDTHREMDRQTDKQKGRKIGMADK